MASVVSFSSVHPGITAALGRLGPILAVVALLNAGCGRSGPAVALHEARGRVEFGPNPPAGARVVLHPKDVAWTLDDLPGGTVGDDGSFRIGTIQSDDGAPAGTYVATVQWFRVGPDGSVGGNAIPQKYASADTSPLIVTVAPGTSELAPLKIIR
jgi:hypothetical protein